MTTMTSDEIDQISEVVKGFHNTLKCVQCLQFPTTVKTSRCGHLFCYDCIKTLMQKQRLVCPVCMKSLDQHSIGKSKYVEKLIADYKLLMDAIKLDAGIKFDQSESKSTKQVGQRRRNSALQGSFSDVASLQNQSTSSIRGKATNRLRKKKTTPSELENVESSRSENTNRSTNAGPVKRSQRLLGKVNKGTGEGSNRVESITDAIEVVESVEKVNEWLNSEEFVGKSDDEDYTVDKLCPKKVSEATDATADHLKYKSFTFAKKDGQSTSKMQGTTESKISPAEAISRTKETWSELALLKKEMRPKTRRRRLNVNIEQLQNTKISNDPTRQGIVESDKEIEAIDSNEDDGVPTVAQSKKQSTSSARKLVVTSDVTLRDNDSMNIEELNRNQVKEIIGVSTSRGNPNCSKSTLNSSGNLSSKSNKFRLSLQHRNDPERREPSPAKEPSPNQGHEKSNTSIGCPPKSIRLSVSRKSTPTKDSPLKLDANDWIAERDIPADIPLGKTPKQPLEKKLDGLLHTTKTSTKELGEASLPRTLPSDRSKVKGCVSAASSEYQSSFRFQSSKTRLVTMKKLGRLFKPKNKVKFLWHRSMKSAFSGHCLRLRSTDALVTTKTHHRLYNPTDISVRSVETQTDESTLRCKCSVVGGKKTPEKSCSGVERSSFGRVASAGIQESNKLAKRTRTSSNVTLLSPQQDSQLKFLAKNRSPAVEGVRKRSGPKKSPSKTLTVSSESESEKVDDILKSETIMQNAKRLATVLLRTDSEDMVATEDEKRRPNGNLSKVIAKQKSTDGLSCEKQSSRTKVSLENNDSCYEKRKSCQKRKRAKGSAKCGKNITISSSSESDKDASTIINRSIEKRGTSRNSERSDNSAAEKQKVVRKLNYSPELEENQESGATEHQKKKFSRIENHSSSDSDELVVSLPSRKSPQSANIVTRANSSRSLSKHDKAANFSVQFTSNMETQESKRKRSLSPDSLDIQQIVTQWRAELTDSEPVIEAVKHEVQPSKKTKRSALEAEVTDSDNKSTVILNQSDEENFPVSSPTAIHGVEYKNFASTNRDASKLGNLANSGPPEQNLKSSNGVNSPAKSTRTVLSDCYRGAFEDNFDEALAKIDETNEHLSRNSKNEAKNRTQSATGSLIGSGRRGSTETTKSLNALSEKLSRDLDKQNKLSNNSDIGCINSEDFIDSMSMPSRRASDAGRNHCRSRSSLKMGHDDADEIAGQVDQGQFEKSFNSEHLNITQEEILFREIEGNLLGRKKTAESVKSSPRKGQIANKNPDVEASKVANAGEMIEEAGKIDKVHPIDGAIFSDEDIVESTPKKKTLAKKDLQDLSRASPCSVVSRKSLLLRDTTPIARAKSALVEKTLDISPIVEKSSSKLSSASLREQQASKLHQSTPKSVRDKLVANLQQKEKKLCFMCTGLLPAQVGTVKTFAREINASYVTEYKPEVTHVIVKTDEESNGAPITIKYLFGIVNKKWIVSYQWVLDCLSQKKLLDEEKYEAVDHDTREPGPRRSRLSTAGLFDLFAFLCIEPFLFIKPSQLQHLLLTSGGTIVNTLEALAAQSDKFKVLLYQTESHSTTVVQNWYNDFRVLPVSVDWITDSISQYSLCPLSVYLPSENPDYALVLGFPHKLVIDDEEYDTTMDVTS